MSKKSRFYEVTYRDGHGDHPTLFPAQSEADLSQKLKFPRTVKHVETRHAGWLPVAVEANEHLDGVEFRVTHKGTETTISKDSLGYDHLIKLFAKDVAVLQRDLDEHNAPDA
ncbi:hypothetical protein HG421_10165 [Xanthomonas campestris pv. badrii]|uniref:Uncharacterized protein n=1 Tax=Xanthomonas campestris pv. badrii TaxID=149696 RepID=A0A7Z2ZI00_XANCA|nr:hypothetical protein [Xanthomonas campestris]QJD68040.1 hypothetical protein HG421_10165 [Xanthomonas campestris pv. badrii]